MSDLAGTLIELLDGDVVRLETDDLDVEAEVIDHEREPHPEGGGPDWRYTIRFMPVGEDATAVVADRYHVAVEPDDGGWTVGELFAEVYVEEELEYASESRGDLVGVEVLGRP